ncbi:hypothetical protein GA0115233_104536 [Streptomyces sp. DI166]|nr:hypothetical protein GA0115233_104536 [Streptomyces sp. DI166]
MTKGPRVTKTRGPLRVPYARQSFCWRLGRQTTNALVCWTS